MEQDFDELYKLLRGSRFATIVLDARIKFLEGELDEAAKMLASVHESYVDSRHASLKDSTTVPDPKARVVLDKDARMQVRRKEKAIETIEQIEALQESLKKWIAKQQRNKPASTATPASNAPPESRQHAAITAATPQAEPNEQAPTTPAPSPTNVRGECPSVELAESLIQQFERETGSHERLLALGNHFEFAYVDKAHSVASGSLYFIEINAEQNFLVVTGDPALVDEGVNLFLAIGGTRIKPFPLEKFLGYGVSGKITWLRPKAMPVNKSTDSLATSSTDATPEEPDKQPASQTNSETHEETAGGMDINERDTILDSGAFTQLVEAAQRSGIVPGVSTIIQLRDCEFRLGRYLQALQKMEGLFGAFCGTASQRTQQLLREEKEIASGKLKLAPKELQAKRMRDNAATDAIERARHRFTRVLDGLRLLIHRIGETDPSVDSNADQAKAD